MTTTVTQDWSFPLHLFDAFGIEMEYIIVDRQTLDVRPICDALFRAVTGEVACDVEPDGPGGVVSWSNELALHVVELKTRAPVVSLDGLTDSFQASVRRINGLLEPMGAMLLPTAMHPWMDPDRETRLWSHEYTEIYKAYDRIFGCRGHGWGNLQSTHINLPFANDQEFGRLHAALRLVLPILPCIASSSPIIDGAWSGLMCNRMEVYRTNSSRIPLMTGLVVPEPIYTRDAYERDVLGRLYQQLAPLDPEGILQQPFANARGAMARFDRGAIEIRVLDIQECPLADLAIAALIIEVVRALADERWSGLDAQCAVQAEPLHAVLLQTIRDAEEAVIAEPALLQSFGVRQASIPASELWAQLLAQVMPDHPVWTPVLTQLLSMGTLSTRIGRRLNRSTDRSDLHGVYRELAGCLERGALFVA